MTKRNGNMVFHRTKKSNPFTQIDNRLVNDKNLSFKARGIHQYMLSKPEDWCFNMTDLLNHTKDRESSVSSGIRELKRIGYLEIIPERDKHGRFERWVYHVYECPRDNDKNIKISEISVKYDGNNHSVHFPLMVNQGHTNTYSSFPVPEKREKDIYSIFKFWNHREIIVHRKLSKNIFKAINSVLKLYSCSDITKAIQNYSYVLGDENSFFTHRWTLINFLSKGLEKFLDDADPINNYKKRKVEFEDDLYDQKIERDIENRISSGDYAPCDQEFERDIENRISSGDSDEQIEEVGKESELDDDEPPWTIHHKRKHSGE